METSQPQRAWLTEVPPTVTNAKEPYTGNWQAFGFENMPTQGTHYNFLASKSRYHGRDHL